MELAANGLMLYAFSEKFEFSRNTSYINQEATQRVSEQTLKLEQSGVLLQSSKLDGSSQDKLNVKYPVYNLHQGAGGSPNRVQTHSLLESAIGQNIDKIDMSGTANRPLDAFTYGNVIDKIEEKYGISVKGTFGSFFSETGTEITDRVDTNAVQNYFSPEKTAGRIVDFATGFMDTYMGLNNNKNPDFVMNSFRELIDGAIDSGFGQVRSLIGDSLPEHVTKMLDETRHLITVKLDDFFSNFYNHRPVTEEPNTPNVDPDRNKSLAQSN